VALTPSTTHGGHPASRGAAGGFLSALQLIDLLFEFGDPLLALNKGTRSIRDPLDLGHQAFN